MSSWSTNKPNTGRRGYGHAHQQERARLAAQLHDGDPCPRCRQPMFRWMLDLGPTDRHGLDADHIDRAASDGGQPDALVHRRCNKIAGAVAANAARGNVVRARRPPEPHPGLDP